VTDGNVNLLYRQRLNRYFAERGAEIAIHVMPPGESQKSMESLVNIFDAIERFGIRRYSDPIFAIGGGVVTDTVGCAAHLYRRGTPHIRIPTTLVGLVDAGIGVKVGVNFRNHKNLIGSYQPPMISVMDRKFLATLPLRHVRNGMAEIIKIAIVCDSSLFDILESAMDELLDERLQTDLGFRVIDHSITAMLEQIRINPWEHELRRPADFGHTFSPRIEMDSNGSLLHGESVAIDMALCCGIALRRGLLDDVSASRIVDVLISAGLPLCHKLSTPPRLCRALEDTMSHRDGWQHIFLPTAIGRGVFVEDISVDDIEESLRWVCELCDTGGLK
jgi:3-dehydroquinate synthase